MKKLKKLGLIILTVIILSGSIAVYAKFYFIPFYKRIVFSKVNIDKHKKTIEQMNVNVFLNEKETNKLKTTKEEFRAALKGLPQSERNPEIVRSILDIGDLSEISVETVSFGKVSEVGVKDDDREDSKAIHNSRSNKKDKLIMVPIKLSLKGNYLQIKKFITLLEEDKRIVQIDNISISNNTADIDMVYYYFNSSVNLEEPYDFCNKTYGKEDMFK